MRCLSEIRRLAEPCPAGEHARDGRLVNTERGSDLSLRQRSTGHADRPRSGSVYHREVGRLPMSGAIAQCSVLHVLQSSTGEQVIKAQTGLHVTRMPHVDPARKYDTMGMLVVPAVSCRAMPVGVPIVCIDGGDLDQAAAVCDRDQGFDQVAAVDTNVHDLSVLDRVS